MESVAPDLLGKFLRASKKGEWLRVRGMNVQFKDLVVKEMATPSSLFGTAKSAEDLFPRPDGLTGVGPMVTIECRVGRNPISMTKDICILDFQDLVGTGPTKTAVLDVPAEEAAAINEFRRKMGKPESEIKWSVTNRLTWKGQVLGLDFPRTMGRNALRCAAKVHFKTQKDVWDQYATFAEQKYQDMNTDVRGYAWTLPFASFSVFPHDTMRPADADGFVEIPVYWSLGGPKDPSRSRGWAVEMDALFYALGGKYQGTIRVKLNPQFSAPLDGGSVSRPAPEVLRLGAGAGASPSLLRRAGQCPLVFAHRGVIDQNLDVENEGGMVERAYRGGADGIEADVYMVQKYRQTPGAVADRSKDYDNDYDFVLSHDGNMNRLLGLLHRSGMGKGSGRQQEVFTENEIVNKYTIYSIRTLERLMHCEIAPPLSRIFTDLKKYPLLMDVDTKPNDPTGPPWPGYGADLGAKLAKMIYAYGLERQIVVTGFAPEVVQAVSGTPVPEGRTRIATGITEWKGIAGMYLKIRNARFDVGTHETARLCNLKSMCTDDTIKDFHSRGYPVGSYILFDVNEDSSDYSYKPEAFNAALKTDWIETDNVPVTLAKVKATGCQWDNTKVPLPLAGGAGGAGGSVISSVSLPPKKQQRQNANRVSNNKKRVVKK
jgi:hypothetical protein